MLVVCDKSKVGKTEIVPFSVLEGCSVNVAEVFFETEVDA